VKPVPCLLLLLAGCGLGRPDRERLGDVAWHEARWNDAMVAYRAADDAPRVTAKLADAALQGGALAESAAAWTKLGPDAPDRAAEAAAGLARVADAADQQGMQGVIASAILGLRRIEPTWPVGRIAVRVEHIDTLSPAQQADLVPALLAAGPDRPAADRLLFMLARADQAGDACGAAVPILEGVIRRATEAGLRDSATHVSAVCELKLGLAAMQADHPGDAQRWLDRAAHRLPDSAVGRRALVGYGDALARQGDSTNARIAWRAVAMASAPPDSVTQLALVRLAALAPTVVGDSGFPQPVHQ
jgi:hypothetical protein